jgi:hypothetical protein
MERSSITVDTPQEHRVHLLGVRLAQRTRIHAHLGPRRYAVYGYSERNRTTPSRMLTWPRACQATQSPKNVLAARTLFEEIGALSRQQDLLTNRAMEFTRRRRGIELFKDAAAAPPISPPAHAEATAGETAQDREPQAGSGRRIPAYKCERCGAISGTKSRRGACPHCGFRMVSTVVELRHSATPSTETPPTTQTPPSPELSRTPPAIPDLRGYDRRPDPLEATTQHEFVATMRAYRVWAGEPSLRQMEERCGKKISYSTFRNMLNAETVPKLPSLKIFVEVLGGTAKDVQRWRQGPLGRTSGRPECSGSSA